MRVERIIGGTTLSISGIKGAETPQEIADQTERLIGGSRKSVKVFTQSPRNYSDNPSILKALSEAIGRDVRVEIIGVNDNSHEDALRSLASLGVPVFGVPEWPCPESSGFIVVDGENCQLWEPYLVGQEQRRAYISDHYKYATELEFKFDGIKEKAVRVPQS